MSSPSTESQVGESSRVPTSNHDTLNELLSQKDTPSSSANISNAVATVSKPLMPPAFGIFAKLQQRNAATSSQLAQTTTLPPGRKLRYRLRIEGWERFEKHKVIESKLAELNITSFIHLNKRMGFTSITIDFDKEEDKNNAISILNGNKASTGRILYKPTDEGTVVGFESDGDHKSRDKTHNAEGKKRKEAGANASEDANKKLKSEGEISSLSSISSTSDQHVNVKTSDGALIDSDGESQCKTTMDDIFDANADTQHDVAVDVDNESCTENDRSSSRKQQVSTAVTADIVTPLWRTPYHAQLRRKQTECAAILSRVLKDLKRQDSKFEVYPYTSFKSLSCSGNNAIEYTSPQSSNHLVNHSNHSSQGGSKTAADVPTSSSSTTTTTTITTITTSSSSSSSLSSSSPSPSSSQSSAPSSVVFTKNMICPLEPILRSPSAYGYRNKSEFSFGLDRDGNKICGFQLGNFQDTVTIGEAVNCWSSPKFAEYIAQITTNFCRSQSSWTTWDKAAKSGLLRSLMVRHSDKTKELMIVLQVSPIGLSESQLTSFKEQVKKLFIDSLVVDADGSFAKVCASSQGPDNSSTTRDIKDSDNMDGIEVSTNDSNPATTVNESSSQRLHLTSLQLMYYSGFSNAPLPETSSCEVLYGQDHIHDIVCGLKFRLSVFSFFQVNSLGAEVIYNKVAQWIGLPNSSQENSSRSTSMSSLSSSNISSNSASSQPVLLDVCCGTGTIGLTLARHVKETIGLELVADAIKDAKVNAKLNGITNAKFICGKAETTIRSVFQYLSNPSQYPLAESVAETENSSSIAESIDADSSSSSSSGNTVPTQSNTYSRVHDSAVVAVVDPPRSGLHADVIRAIRTSKIKRLVYVSCNPNTLSENLIKLCGASSSRYKGAPFKAIKAVPVDMFAHTPHCEMIMLLER